MTYQHTQRSPICWLIYAPAAVVCVIAGSQPNDVAATLVFGVLGVVLMLLAASFHHLCVEDEGDTLGIRFGPIPLFRKSIRYDEMLKAEVSRTTLWDGWGIHKSFRGGWVWNIWGFDCVKVTHRSVTWVGTDDAESLQEFLCQKIDARRDSQVG